LPGNGSYSADTVAAKRTVAVSACNANFGTASVGPRVGGRGAPGVESSALLKIWTPKKLRKEAQKHLDDDEEVLFEPVGCGVADNVGGLLMATDRGLVLFVGKQLGHDVQRFSYENISSIHIGKVGLGQTLAFVSFGNEVKLSAIGRKVDLAGFVRVVRERMTAAKSSSGAASAGGDIAEQIRALGQLRDEGLLTPDEFEAKKAALLARM
jgi:hypothetical protein